LLTRAKITEIIDSPIPKKIITYSDAGVNIDASNRAKQRIKYLAQKTFTRGVLSEIGGFGGCFRWAASTPIQCWYRAPDGVGTKLRVAFEMGSHRTVGADLVTTASTTLQCRALRQCSSWTTWRPGSSIRKSP